VRVLVAADDPRFLAVATVLLSGADFVVESTSRRAATRTSFATFGKWESFPEIVAEIERAVGSRGANHRRPSAL
jgi:hypothetical protein